MSPTPPPDAQSGARAWPVAPATRPWNFSAGPAVLPVPVLEQAAAEMLDWRGSGLGVMEMSHRGPQFQQIMQEAEADLRRLLAVPASHRILFMQGGGLAENAIVPLNLSRGEQLDIVVTGAWSAKSAAEARRYAGVHVAATTADARYTRWPEPATWDVDARSRYLHLCSNETIHGVECPELPDLRALGSDAPLVIDCSSHVLSRTIDWSRVGLAFAGAQKNIGPAGLTLVVVREDLLGHALPACPSAFDYGTVAEQGSMYNTPPTYAIYVAGLVFKWVQAQGGVAAMAQRAAARAALLYGAIDGGGLYANPVQRGARSRMNVPFFLNDARLEAPFLAQAAEAGLLQLKGHQSVGGLRASLYNAMPLDGVRALVAFMRDFEARHG